MPKFKHDTVNGLLRYTLLFLLTGLTAFGAWAQINFTANDTIIPYDGYFRAGSNLGEYSGFTDEQLGDLAAGNEALHVDGVGVRALRPALYEDFVENFGYDSRISTYQHYASIGLKDNTVIIGFPSEEHRDPTQHCPGIESTLFRNMYEDIWDNGENGTPVNEENYYAAYVYKLVTRYKDYVRFWEIWNEPGFDYTMNRGWLRPGDEGNWWDNNPDPCDYKLRAPIYHYVRLLRISYEVIKHLDPEAYVAVSGVGYPSFLDAILRNTDNPFGGFVSEDYPLGGGAYFDVMGFHFYPHFDGSLREWNESRQDWDYYRHSDAAADGMLTQKDTFQYVLHQYGYDGQTFPAKEWIITECNLPRKAFGDFIGSDAAQRHFMVKAIVQAMKNDIRQLHIYKLGEDTNYDRATFEFDLMGFYQQLSRKDLYFNELTDGAVAHHSTADLLFAKQYDPVRTAALQLPAQVDGGAFRDSGGNYTYVLWARTSMDQSEEASAVYSFPLSLNVDSLQKKKWDYTQSHFREMIAGSDIPLTGEPVFLSEMMFTSNAMSGCAPFSVQFDDHAPAGAASWSWSFEGGSPASSTLAEPSVIFDQPGIYNVQLEVKDANGNILVNQQDEIVVREAPVVNFNASVSGPLVQFSNLSGNDNEGFVWDFGDGQTSTAPNPTHLYLESGTYTVRLTGGNDCQTVLHEETLSITVPTRSKLDFTANDSLIAYDGHFRPGVNLKFYSAWTDEGLADIAAGNIETDIEGVGAKAVRTLLPESFLTGWTYDIRESAFNHYVNLDLSDNTVVLGFPSASSIDTTEYCPGQRSELFRDLYLDIWDDGSDGTPINELNPYADYVYNTVLVYRDYVQFWQVLNAPGLDATGETGWLPPGEPNNWWDNDPAPCDLVLKAPIQQYIRMLRISYEVIKYLDPEASVTIAGIGFPSFLDALLRNTDNPIDGSVATGYSLKGGAYFDALGYNVYPFVDGSTSYYDTDIGGFIYKRHSDAAVSSIANNKNTFQQVLSQYGYDGSTYPLKDWMIAAINIPRRSFNNYIGSDEAQRNFIVKAYVSAMQEGISQMAVEALAEAKPVANASSENDVMGLYASIANQSNAEIELTPEGVAFKTTSHLLYGSEYDATRTAALNLPEGVKGAAFKNSTGTYIYVLWAATTTDQAEEASASYTFPASFGESELILRAWDYSSTGIDSMVQADAIELSATPVFLLTDEDLLQTPIALFVSDNQKSCAPFSVNFTGQAERADSYLWHFPGGSPASSTEVNPTVVYEEPGVYSMSLEVSNAAGSHRYTRLAYVTADSIPEADFDYSVEGPWVQFSNEAVNATRVVWNFGDGALDYSFTPRHYYFFNGNYQVQLIAENECGSDTLTQTIVIDSAPSADFQVEVPEGCGPLEVQFRDMSASSPTSWSWSFEGGTPASSIFPNPQVSFPSTGIYEVDLIVSNEFGTDTLRKQIEINADAIAYRSEVLCEGTSVQINGVSYSAENPVDTQRLAMASQQGCDSLLIIDLEFLASSTTEINDTINPGESYTVGNSSYTTTGSYTDTLSNSIGCDSIVVLHLTVLTTGTQEALQQQLDFRAFPNPFDQQLNVSFQLPGEASVSLELVDLLGRRLHRVLSDNSLTKGAHRFELDTSSLPAGLYFCRLIIDNQSVSVGVAHVLDR